MGEGDRGEGQSVVGTKTPQKQPSGKAKGRDPLAQGVGGYGGGTDARSEKAGTVPVPRRHWVVGAVMARQIAQWEGGAEAWIPAGWGEGGAVRRVCEGP